MNRRTGFLRTRSGVLSGLALAGWLVASAGAAMSSLPVAELGPAPARVLVMPFESDATLPQTYWLGEGMAVLVSDELQAVGAFVITREQRVRAFEEMLLPSAGTLSRATIIRAGQVLGAGHVVFGSVELADEALVVRVRSLRLDAGQLHPEVVERGPVQDLLDIARRVSNRVATQMAAGRPEASPGRVAGSAPPLEAFEWYIKGLLAEEPETRAQLLRAALKRFPRYDRALVGLWDVETSRGNPAAALAAVKQVAESSPIVREARFRAALSRIEVRQYDEAFALLRELNEERPVPAVLNNLGVVQVRRGSTPQTGKATYYFNKAAESDPEDPDLFFNLGYAYWLDRDPQASIYWLREAVRREPADGDAHYVLSAALQVAGASAEAARERELAKKLSSKYREWERRGAAEPVPRGLERVKSDLSPLRGSPGGPASTRVLQRNATEHASFYLERAQRFHEDGRDSEALAEARRAVYLSPYDAEVLLLLGRVHLRSGRSREAADVLRISLWSAESAAARAVLGLALVEAKELDAARLELQRAQALDPASPDAKLLADKLNEMVPR
jgi:tetratricopeptide (TPR) repeat protein